MAQTTFNEIFERLLKKLENDREFFEYYNVSVSEVEEIILEKINGYLKDAIDLIVSRTRGNIEVDLYDYNEDTQMFNVELTSREIGIIANHMYEVHLSRDEMLVKAMKLRMSLSDINRFSPANERTSFMNMLSQIRRENEIDVSVYTSTDRKTGARKVINHSLYNYDE